MAITLLCQPIHFEEEPNIFFPTQLAGLNLLKGSDWQILNREHLHLLSI